MSVPRPADDELPPLPPLDGGDEPPRADEEDEGEDGEESVGLDDATGSDELLDDELDAGDESESYLEGSEPDESDEEDEVDAPGDEGGWAAFDAPQGGSDGDDEDDGEDEALAVVDRGEEGLVDEEPVRGTEDDDAELPAAASGPDTGDLPDESLDLPDDGDVGPSDADDEAERRLSGAVLPPALGPAVTARWVLLEGGAAALAEVPGGVLVAGTTLARVDHAVHPLGARGLDALGVGSLLVSPERPEVVLAGTRLAGALVSHDGGETFAPANGWHREPGTVTRAFDVTLERHAGGARVWGRTGGAVYRSEDLGRTWHGPLMVAPAVALAACARGERGVAVVGAGGGDARLMLSKDGGLRWSSQALPARPAGAGDALLALAGDVVAFGWEHDGRGLTLREGERDTRVPELAAASHVALVPTAGGAELWAVLFFRGSDRSVLVRRDARGALRTVADVAALTAGAARDVGGDDETDGRVRALLVRADGARRDAWLATARGLLHVATSGDP